VRPAYGFVLLAERAGPPTPVELAAALDVSKQAASKVAHAMVADGLLTKVGEAGVAETRSRLTRVLRVAHGGALPTIKPSWT
jgi:Mn-dependent DtxR family transcriptional regulator